MKLLLELVPGGDKIFRISDDDAKSLVIEQDILRPSLIGREIQPYFVPDQTGYSIIYSTKSVTRKVIPIQFNTLCLIKINYLKEAKPVKVSLLGVY